MPTLDVSGLCYALYRRFCSHSWFRTAVSTCFAYPLLSLAIRLCLHHVPHTSRHSVAFSGRLRRAFFPVVHRKPITAYRLLYRAMRRHICAHLYLRSVAPHLNRVETQTFRRRAPPRLFAPSPLLATCSLLADQISVVTTASFSRRAPATIRRIFCTPAPMACRLFILPDLPDLIPVAVTY